MEVIHYGTARPWLKSKAVNQKSQQGRGWEQVNWGLNKIFGNFPSVWLQIMVRAPNISLPTFSSVTVTSCPLFPKMFKGGRLGCFVTITNSFKNWKNTIKIKQDVQYDPQLYESSQEIPGQPFFFQKRTSRAGGVILKLSSKFPKYEK